MDIGRLFSFSGRASRRTYWRVQLAVALIGGASWVGGLLLAVSTGVGALAAVALAGLAPMAVMLLATVFRRLHDRGKSGWWLLAFYLGPFAALAAIGPSAGASEAPTALAGVAALLALALLIWGFVEIGLLPGSAGPNRFGPEPVRA